MSWTSEPLDDVAHHAGSLPVALTHLDIICRASICTAASTEDNPPEQSDSGMTYLALPGPTWPYLALPVAPVAILILGPRLVLEGELEEQAVNLGRAVSNQVLQPAAKAAGCGIRPGP